MRLARSLFSLTGFFLLRFPFLLLYFLSLLLLGLCPRFVFIPFPHAFLILHHFVPKKNLQKVVFGSYLTHLIFELHSKFWITIFSYLVNQAHLKNIVIRIKPSTNHLFDMCTFQTIKSWRIVAWKFQIQ